MTDKHFSWEDGIPTQPDVDTLLKAWPPETMKQGEWRVSDVQIKAKIGRCDGNRYRTVCEAWKHRLNKDHSIVIYRSRNWGYYAPTADEIFAQTHPAITHAGRTYAHQKRAVAIANPTDTNGKIIQGHQGQLLAVLQREARRSGMNSLPSTITKDMPRIGAPKQSSDKI